MLFVLIKILHDGKLLQHLEVSICISINKYEQWQKFKVVIGGGLVSNISDQNILEKGSALIPYSVHISFKLFYA